MSDGVHALKGQLRPSRYLSSPSLESSTTHSGQNMRSQYTLRMHSPRLPQILCIAIQGRKSNKAKPAAKPTALPASASASSFTGRDLGLTLFHALGKFLYNKRLPEPDVTVGALAAGGEGVGLSGSFIDLCSDSEAEDSPGISTGGTAPALASWYGPVNGEAHDNYPCKNPLQMISCKMSLHASDS